MYAKTSQEASHPSPMRNTRRERLLVTVKTYPTLSTKYGETVCTAGVREDGSWVRLYPVPFRRLNGGEQYRKYDWLECSLARHTSDPRPESYRPIDNSELQPVGHLDTADKWRERKRILLDSAPVYDRLDEVIAAAKANEISLCVFKPTTVTGLISEEEDRNWDEAKLRKMRAIHGQLALFEDNDWRKTFKVIPKLPYSFSYRFVDSVGKASELQILDWEVGALYWNCLYSSDGDEAAALAKVRQMYLDQFLTTDLHFFMGTTQQWHSVGRNPWVIVGIFPAPHDDRLRLF